MDLNGNVYHNLPHICRFIGSSHTLLFPSRLMLIPKAHACEVSLVNKFSQILSEYILILPYSLKKV